MTATRFLMVVMVVAVMGCGPSRSRMSALCQQSTGLGEGLCDCLADKASRELSLNARRFLVATMEQDSRRAAELRGELTLDEAAEAGRFFVSGSAACIGRPDD